MKLIQKHFFYNFFFELLKVFKQSDYQEKQNNHFLTNKCTTTTTCDAVRVSLKVPTCFYKKFHYTTAKNLLRMCLLQPQINIFLECAQIKNIYYKKLIM